MDSISMACIFQWYIFRYGERNRIGVSIIRYTYHHFFNSRTLGAYATRRQDLVNVVCIIICILVIFLTIFHSYITANGIFALKYGYYITILGIITFVISFIGRIFSGRRDWVRLSVLHIKVAAGVWRTTIKSWYLSTMGERIWRTWTVECFSFLFVRYPQVC